jgi:hypothetical protein
MEGLLPPDPELELIHQRQYEVRVFKDGHDRLVVRGAVRDTKPPHLYIPADPSPLVAHHMIVSLVVDYPSLEIAEVDVALEVHPERSCPTITDHYQNLVGISIARGFTHKIRELFGGPRGCTHTTALLQAMAPAVVQATFSMRIALGRETPVRAPKPITAEQRRAMTAVNRGTCHVWAEDGEMVRNLEAGIYGEPPVFIQERCAEIGADPREWFRLARG